MHSDSEPVGHEMMWGLWARATDTAGRIQAKKKAQNYFKNAIELYKADPEAVRGHARARSFFLTHIHECALYHSSFHTHPRGAHTHPHIPTHTHKHTFQEAITHANAHANAYMDTCARTQSRTR